MVKPWILLVVLLGACGNSPAPAENPTDNPGKHYDAHFSARIEPGTGVVRAQLRIEQTKSILRELDLHMPVALYDEIEAEGARREGDRLIWPVPAQGGIVSWRVHTLTQRKPPDAQITAAWALLKLEDIFPAANVRSLKGYRSRSTLTLTSPTDWRMESAYGPATGKTLELPVERNFNRPRGWLLAGDLGVRRDVIEDRRIALAAPKGYSMRRMDTLSFLRWVLPEFVQVFPGLPQRVLIIGAPKTLWRGGLSGYQSVYLHQDRPLISENATSTLVHELAHVAGLHSSVDGADWIVEGLAEYYSLEILRRSGGISNKRFARAITTLREWANTDQAVLTDPSSGANTALAATVMYDLDQELQDGGSSLDLVVASMLAAPPVSVTGLVDATTRALGKSSTTLSAALKL